MHYRYAALVLLLVGAVLAIPLQLKWGLAFFAASFACAYKTRNKGFAVSLAAIMCSLVILAFTPINTDTSNVHFAIMGLGCTAALVLPHLVARFYLRKPLRWRWFSQAQWSPFALGYLVFAAVLAYFLLPWYFSAFPSVPLKWPMPQEYSTDATVRLFIGTNLLGIWDELFFINTVFMLLLRFYSFRIATAAQAVLFTGFLYELGFIAIGPLLILPFTVLQALAFRRTESLTYVIILHLIIDAVLFLTIMNFYYPEFAPFLPY